MVGRATFAARGFETIATRLSAKARTLLSRWGALGKVRQLDALPAGCYL